MERIGMHDQVRRDLCKVIFIVFLLNRPHIRIVHSWFQPQSRFRLGLGTWWWLMVVLNCNPPPPCSTMLLTTAKLVSPALFRHNQNIVWFPLHIKWSNGASLDAQFQDS
uniref:Uncharacterized protein n=1 Tax=Cucumis sativus TaxID=3659 RepID=A0A0A0LPN0_CUCSA